MMPETLLEKQNPSKGRVDRSRQAITVLTQVMKNLAQVVNYLAEFV